MALSSAARHGLVTAHIPDSKTFISLYLDFQSYTIITGDKGYLSRDLKADLAAKAVDLVTPRKSNQLPPPKREQNLYQGHRFVESVFSSLDRLGLSDSPYRSTTGFVIHLSTVILAYQLTHSGAFCVLILFSRIWVTWMRLMFAANVLGAGISGFLVTLLPGFAQRCLFDGAAQDGIVFGVTGSVWFVIGLISILGLRNPVQFAGVFLMRIVYKTVWIALVGLPAMAAGDERASFFVVFSRSSPSALSEVDP